MPDNLTAALTAASRGWHAFPLHPESKRPAVPGHRADDCPGGVGDPWCRQGHAGWEQRATTDRDRITRAWSSHPDRGLGIATGPSGLVVVDLDQAKPGDVAPAPWASLGVSSGAEVLEHLATVHHGAITPTWTVQTISGGTHLYYTAPTGLRLGNTAGSLGWLIDTRAHGGYVVAPPTTIAGQAYATVDDRPVAPLPGWLRELLTAGHTRPTSWPAARTSAQTTRTAAPHALQPDRRSAYVMAALKGEVQAVKNARPGTRNHALFCAAVALGQLVAGGALAEDQAYAALAEAAAAHIGVQGADGRAFVASEADATIRSGFRTGARNPRKAA